MLPGGYCTSPSEKPQGSCKESARVENTFPSLPNISTPVSPRLARLPFLLFVGRSGHVILCLLDLSTGLENSVLVKGPEQSVSQCRRED